MPKERRDRSVSIDKSRASPYQCNTSHSTRPEDENVKEWEEARCPVCIEHPHNAILLLCSSREKGCRPYMCDTSYRHSNCFDQFQKSTSMVELDPPEETTTTVARTMVCPLCRGQVTGWIVVETARVFMNRKSRTCASETCEFSGTYADLRTHARMVHPTVRPSEIDPGRERDWRRLERQRDIGDLLSTLQSSLGDERGEDIINNNNDNNDSVLTFDDGGWLTVFFLIRVFRPRNGSRSSSWSGGSRTRAQVTVRRRPSRDDESSDGGSGNVFEQVRLQPAPENDDES